MQQIPIIHTCVAVRQEISCGVYITVFKTIYRNIFQFFNTPLKTRHCVLRRPKYKYVSYLVN